MCISCHLGKHDCAAKEKGNHVDCKCKECN